MYAIPLVGSRGPPSGGSAGQEVTDAEVPVIMPLSAARRIAMAMRHAGMLQFVGMAAASLFCVLPEELPAQGATGKLEGRVYRDSGAPLGEAQVYLIGSAFGAVSDARGYYFINNIPPGTYQVRAAFIGFRPVQASGLRVL